MLAWTVVISEGSVLRYTPERIVAWGWSKRPSRRRKEDPEHSRTNNRMFGCPRVQVTQRAAL
jgi:hypothetical protein